MNKPNLVLMSGEDTFSLLEEVKRWKDAFVEKHGDSDLEELDGESCRIEQIISSISTTPFLSEKRLVILRNFLSGRKPDEANALIPALEKLPETSILVLAELKDPDKRTSIFKKLSSLATNRLFLRPKGALLTTWVQRRALLGGAACSPDAATYLITLLGDNLFTLESEIQKLTLFAQGQAITPAMIDELVTRNIQKSIFTMTDQLARKDFSGVLTTVRQLQEQGEEAAYIFSMIVRQFRLMLEMRALAEENLPPAMIARKMEVHPFVVQNTLRFAKNFTAAEMKSALQKFLIIDRRLKTGLLSLKPREEDQYLLALERVLLAV